MARYQKAECQRVESLVEKVLQKSAWVLWKYQLDIELLEYTKVRIKAPRAVRCKIPRTHTRLGGIQILSSQTGQMGHVVQKEKDNSRAKTFPD